MAKRNKKDVTPEKAEAKGKTPPKRSPAQEAVHEAGMITGQIVAALKRARIAFLEIGAKLVDFRDRKLYVALKHEDLASYAVDHLDLGRSSLYKYIEVYEWVKKFHPQWLQKPVVGRIPDLSDISDLMWIDEELAKKDLDSKKKATLEEMQKKGLAGDLTRSAVRAFRRRTRGAKESYQVAIRHLQAARRQLTKSANPPSLAIQYIENAIRVLQNQGVLAEAGFGLDEVAEGSTLFFA